MTFPKGWEREAWAKCPECGYLLHTQEEHRCKGMVYRLSFQIQAWEEK